MKSRSPVSENAPTFRQLAFKPSAGPAKRMGRVLASLPTLVLFSLVLFLQGCLVGPNYRRPNVATPATFRGSSGAAQQASIADLPWWEIFKDETLKDLVKTSLANNYDLAVAVARVEQARQVAAEARSQYFPATNYSSAITYGHNQFVSSPLQPRWRSRIPSERGQRNMGGGHLGQDPATGRGSQSPILQRRRKPGGE